MPAFDTPQPIAASLDLGVADVRITASDRTDTLVEIRPSDENDQSDVAAAQQVRVDFANGVLHVTAPRARAFVSRKSRSVDVVIDLPSGSRVSGEMQVGDVRSAGRLGECTFKTSAGNIRLEQTGALRLDTSAGHITADAVAGNADISTSSGKVRLGEVEGTTTIKNSNGSTTIDAAGGDVRIRAANGDIVVESAGAGVDAKTSNGSIRLGRVVRGSVVAQTAMGDVEVGIAEGTAAWLEVNTGLGHVRNLLENTDQPDATDETVEVRGRTSFGDVIIRRS